MYKLVVVVVLLGLRGLGVTYGTDLLDHSRLEDKFY